MKKLLMVLLIALSGIAKAQTGYKIGDIATDFNLKNVDNKMISMANYKEAKGFFVIFHCNQCPYSKAYESRIIALNAKYASKGLPVMTINPNDPAINPEDSFENMKIRAKQEKYTFPYLVDDSQDIAKAYGAKATPHVYLLKKTDKGLVVSYIGAIDNDTENVNDAKIKYAENAAEALLAGKEIELTQTKAIGCSIKWKKTAQ
ncbi:thioredoxin family protein [Pedobacter cryophilus]|uniref:Thioredoxin family protein n=1 Tax=Pedobacter cryophilus TaxID=2571271 RepID=A0A4U1BZE1_9SPHI|nr:thioredoxin family protein [Pedobacter cryophilus]TKB97063.1 thioredoxin family protein [Pedobacter cryophilus]